MIPKLTDIRYYTCNRNEKVKENFFDDVDVDVNAGCGCSPCKCSIDCMMTETQKRKMIKSKIAS